MGSCRVAVATGLSEPRAGRETGPGREGRGRHRVAALGLHLDQPQGGAFPAGDDEPVATHPQKSARRGLRVFRSLGSGSLARCLSWGALRTPQTPARSLGSGSLARCLSWGALRTPQTPARSLGRESLARCLSWGALRTPQTPAPPLGRESLARWLRW